MSADVEEDEAGRGTGERRPPPGGGDPAFGGRPGRRRPTVDRSKGGYSLLLKDSVIYGAGRALQKFLVALLLPLYTAFLSREDYGILGLVVTVTTFLDVFVTLGFDVAFSRFYFDDKDEAARRRVITNTFYVSTVYPALLIGTAVVLMPTVAPWLMGGQYESGDWRFFAVALVTLWFSNLNDLPFTLFRLEHRPWIFSAFTLGRVFVQIPLSVLFVAVFDWGPMGVLLANLFTAAGMQALLLPTYIRKVDWAWHWQLMRPMLAFAVPALFTGISFYWLKLSDRWFLLHYQGKAEVGLYTVAYSLSQPLYLTLMAFRMAWPQWHYGRLHEPEKHKQLVARSSTYFLGLNAVVLVLMGTFLPILVHVFLNERYWSVGPATFVLSLSVVLYAVYFVFWVGSNVAKKNRMIPVFFLIASGANIAANFVVVPIYGMWGAAWTHVMGYAILAATVYFYSEHWYPIPYEWRRLVTLVVAAAVTLSAVWALAAATGQSVDMPLGELLARQLAAVPLLLLFPLLLWLLRFWTPGERQRLRRTAARVPGLGGLAPATAAVGAAAAAGGGDGELGTGGALTAPVDVTGAVLAAARADGAPGEDRGARLTADDVAAEEEETELEARAQLNVTEGGDTLQ